MARVFSLITRETSARIIYRSVEFSSQILRNAALRNIFVSFGNKEARWKVAHPGRGDDLQLLSDNVAKTSASTLLLHVVLGIVLLQLETVPLPLLHSVSPLSTSGKNE